MFTNNLIKIKRSKEIQEEIVLFPGCVISYRLPFIEVSIRNIFDHLGIFYTENSKFSCCPEPNGIKNSNKLLYSIAAARNLALAEKEGKSIITPCNGCFTTFKKIKGELEENNYFKQEINKYLNKIDLEIRGDSEIFHMVEFFFKFSREAIKDNLQYPLMGLKVAVFYGCHFLRPSNKVQIDDPLEPSIFDNLIEDLGAQSIDYELKMECCGGSLGRAGNPVLSSEIISAKLASMKEKGADCIVVCCPQCFIQFDHLQQDLKKEENIYDIPVLYYSELLCIALGVDIQAMMNKHHRTQVKSLYNKIELIKAKYEEIRKQFDLKFLLKCYSCKACDDDCIIANKTNFKPSEIVGKLLEGKVEEVISDPSIWLCLDCYLCYELCPMRIGLIEIFSKLRNLATERGYTTKGYSGEFKTFYQNGTVGLFSKAARTRVGLHSTKPDVGDLKELFNIIERENVKPDS
ncbi:MAG: heterodisulfide reductase-related iron-sulfur binding cluster [Promethearchaeota archaeon]